MPEVLGELCISEQKKPEVEDVTRKNTEGVLLKLKYEKNSGRAVLSLEVVDFSQDFFVNCVSPS